MIAKQSRLHVFRLYRGEDLRGAIETYVQKNGIRAAAVLSAVGCVSRLHIRDASGVTEHTKEDRFEIVSLMGTVGERTHLHVSFAGEDLAVIGGHLLSGCTVNTTAEIILEELVGLRFSSEWDAETGYHELRIEQTEES